MSIALALLPVADAVRAGTATDPPTPGRGHDLRHSSPLLALEHVDHLLLMCFAGFSFVDLRLRRLTLVMLGGRVLAAVQGRAYPVAFTARCEILPGQWPMEYRRQALRQAVDTLTMVRGQRMANK